MINYFPENCFKHFVFFPGFLHGCNFLYESASMRSDEVIGAWVKSTGSTSLQEVHHSTPPVGETPGDLSGYLCESPAMGGWRFAISQETTI